MSDWVQAISQFTEHHLGAIMFIIMAILPLLFPQTWRAMNAASMRFEEKNKRIILTIAILVILTTIGFLIHFLLVTAPKDYPTAN